MHSGEYADFNMNLFKQSVWVRYNDNTRLLGVILGVIGSLLISYILVLIKKKLMLWKDKVSINI